MRSFAQHSHQLQNKAASFLKAVSHSSVSLNRTDTHTSPPTSSSGLNHDFARIPVHSSVRHLEQPYTLTAPDDKQEVEADKIADSVMAMPTSHWSQNSQRPTRLAEGGCFIQRHISASRSPGTVAPSIVGDVLNSPGIPLPEQTRLSMEDRFGHDFSHVRVHQDHQAAISADSISARAFTHGSHIVFGSNQCDFSRRDGQHLLAHELAHTIQQGGPTNSIQRKPATNQNSSVNLRIAEVFSDPEIQEARSKLEKNAESKLMRWISEYLFFEPHVETRNCILTVREIVLPALYRGEDLKQIQRSVQSSAKHNTMPEVMSGLTKAGFASKLHRIHFKEQATTFEKGTEYEHTLTALPQQEEGKGTGIEVSEKLSEYVEGQLNGIDGWHVFGMSVMNGYHSVTLFVKHQAGKTRFYWADQQRVESEMHEPDSEMGFREYSKDQLDNYVAFYTANAWNRVHDQNLRAVKEGKKPTTKGWEARNKLDYSPTYLEIWKLYSMKDRGRGTKPRTKGKRNPDSQSRG